MKRWIFILILVACACSWIWAQQPAADDVRPDAGTIQAGVYTNPYFNFSYTLPAGWNGRLIQKSQPGQPSRFYQMLNALPANAGASIQYMGIQAEDINGTNVKTARDFLTASPIFAASSSYASIAPVIETVISGRTFARADFKSKPTQDDLGLTMYQTQLVTLVGHYAITISITADDRAALEKLDTSINSMAFAAPPAPVTPAGDAPPVVIASAPAPTPVSVTATKNAAKAASQPVATGATVEMSITDDAPAAALRPVELPAVKPQPAATDTNPSATSNTNPMSQPASAASTATPAAATPSTAVITTASSKPAKPSAGIPLDTPPASTPAPAAPAPATTQPVLLASASPNVVTSVPSVTPAPIAAPKNDSATMTVTDTDSAPVVNVSGVTKVSDDRVKLTESALADYIFSRSGLSYPQQAKDLNIEGKVVIGVLITQDGHVRSVKLISGPPQLAGAAMDSVRNWRFIPYLDNGHPMEVESQVSINFTLKH